MTIIKRNIATTIFMIMIIIASIINSSSAKSHSWYDPQCCSDTDCAPIIKPLEYLDNGEILATTEIGTTIIPADAKRLPSQDDKVHVCMSKIAKGFTPSGIVVHHFYCIYEIAGG